MKKITLLFLLVFSSVSILMADIVTQSDAAKVAKNHYFSYATATDYSSITIKPGFYKNHRWRAGLLYLQCWRKQRIRNCFG